MEGKISLETLQLVGVWMLTLEIMLPHSESQRFGRLLSQRKLVAACQTGKANYAWNLWRKVENLEPNSNSKIYVPDSPSRSKGLFNVLSNVLFCSFIYSIHEKQYAYCWGKNSCTTGDVQNLINQWDKPPTLNWLAGFLPSKHPSDSVLHRLVGRPSDVVRNFSPESTTQRP